MAEVTLYDVYACIFSLFVTVIISAEEPEEVKT